MTVAYNEGNGEFKRTKSIYSIAQLTSLTAGNLNGDGIDDIVLVQREQNKIHILLSSTDSTYYEQTFSVNFYPETAVIGDLTGDNIPDIITFGKLSSGISVIRGKGKNTFREAKTLFGSLPVSSLSIISLNADKIPDVVLHNWLHNEDVFFFGIGNLQFSEQSALTYGIDSTISMFDDFNNDGITDVIVASSQNSTLQVLHGNGLANITRKQNFSVNQNLVSLQALTFNESPLRNLLVSNSSNESFTLLLNKGNGMFYDGIDFGVPYQYWHILSGDLDGDGFNDLVCFDDSSNQYTVFWNALSDNQSKKSNSIAVGKSPNSISVYDLNKDGLDDVLVTNEISNTVSISYGSSRGLSSQISIETPEAPSSVIVYSITDTSMTIVTAHKSTEKLGLSTISNAIESKRVPFDDVEGYTLSLSVRPSYILPDASLNRKQISLYVFSQGNDNSIIFYRQLQESQFVAKSITPLIPSKILFATISDFNDDSFSDLVYLYNDKIASRDFLGVTLNDEKDEFKGKTFSYEMPDSGNSQAYIYVADIDADQRKDFLIYLQPTEKIYLMANKGTENYQPKLLTENVFIKQYEHIQIYDFDADGINDIVYLDSGISKLMYLKGRFKDSFHPAQVLMDLPGISVFNCGDFNGDGLSDIIYIQTQTHTISILYGSKN